MIVASTRITTNKNNKSKRTRTATTTANTRGWWVLIPKKGPTQQTFPPKKYQPPKHHHPLTTGTFPFNFPGRKKTAFPNHQTAGDPPRWTTRAMASWFVASTNVTIRRSSTRPGENDFRSKKIFFSRKFWELSGWQPVSRKHFCWMIFFL